MIWLKFIAIQLVMLLATIVGWVLLIPICLAQAWHKDFSVSDRVIDVWPYVWMNKIYGNPEDGVSGQQALVWNAEGTAKVPYMPGAWAPWRAYCWSAWRNSADNLKYVFAGAPGQALPLLTFRLFNRTCKIGWQGGLPVLSL